MEHSTERYGLTLHEARRVGLSEGSDQAVNKDVELEGAILRHLRLMGAEQVRVSVRFGRAFLTGICEDYRQKRDVFQAVRSMAGDGRVVNQIKVFPSEAGRS